MPRNPRTELPYDPIRADLVREVTTSVRRLPEAPALAIPDPDAPETRTAARAQHHEATRADPG